MPGRWPLGRRASPLLPLTFPIWLGSGGELRPGQQDAVVSELVSFLILLELQRFPLNQLEEWENSWKEFDSLENLSGKELLALQIFFSSFKNN